MSEWTDKELAHYHTLFNLVKDENVRQIDKWGIQKCTPFEWMCYLTEEVGELAEAINKHAYREGFSVEVMKEAIQVATLSLKIAEMAMEEEE